jgi:hypothetical protein
MTMMPWVEVVSLSDSRTDSESWKDGAGDAFQQLLLRCGRLGGGEAGVQFQGRCGAFGHEAFAFDEDEVALTSLRARGGRV